MNPQSAATEALRLAEERFRSAFDEAPIGMALVSLDGAWLQVNRMLCEIVGHSEPELLTLDWGDVIHSGDRIASAELRRRLLSGELRSLQVEQQLVHRDGRLLQARVSTSIVRDADGAPLHFVSQIEDITAASRVEAERDRALAQLEEAQRIAGIGSWSWNRLTHEAYWSRELYRLFGRDPSAGVPQGPAMDAYVAGADRATIAQLKHRTGPFEFDFAIRTDDGVARTLRALGRQDPENRDMFSGTVQDVTAMREHERRLAEAQTMAHVGWWEWNVGEAAARCSDELCTILGLAAGSTATIDIFDTLIHADDHDRAIQRFWHTARHGTESASDFRIVTATGAIRHVQARQYGQVGPDGQVIRLIGTIQDITERAQREAEQRALRGLAELVARTAGPAAVFEQVASDILSLFDCHSGVVVRFDESTNTATFLNAVLHDGRSLTGATLDLNGDSAPAIVYRTGAAGRTVGAPSSGVDAHLGAIVAEISDSVAAPIVVGGRLWGCLAAAFHGGLAPDGTEDRLEHFANLVAMAIANAEAWQTLSHQASTDAITGLANYRAFQDRLASEMARAERHGRPLSLILLDLDHFKAVNDGFGHQVGDRVLAEVGRRLSLHARRGDVVARIGGEEFAWLLPETDRQEALRAAERLRARMASEPIEAVGLITISAGVCTSRDAVGADALVRHADRALYWAKDAGRNVSFLYSEEADAVLGEQASRSLHHGTVGSVRALAQAIDSKDSSTREHSERVAALAERLALTLGWTQKRAGSLYDCGVLHDVGKIGIPDEIILKPGTLSAEEYELVKQHAQMSARIASDVLEHEQVTWVRGHHERWDGSGYPDSLSGEQIPDGAQILAVADAYDVMTQSRAYQEPRSPVDALAECRQLAGRQFSPVVVDALGAVVEEDLDLLGAHAQELPRSA